MPTVWSIGLRYAVHFDHSDCSLLNIDTHPKKCDNESNMMALFGPPNIEKLAARRNVKSLIKALNYEKSVDIRREAARALGKIGEAQAVEPLSAALKDGKYSVREMAAWGLGAIGDARAVEPLITALEDRDEDVRRHVLEALGAIGDSRAVGPLIYALRIRPIRERMQIASVLVGMYRKQMLDPQAKQQILSLRPEIQRSHTDRSRETAHEDRFRSDDDCGKHEDNPGHKNHTDFGIGVKFPL
jgi:HEAT repeat protein